MSKYLELFKGVMGDISEKIKFENRPYVAYSVKDDKVVYTSVNRFITFKAAQENSTIGLNKLSTNHNLEYSTNLTDWNVMDISTNINLENINDEVYIRGILKENNTDSNYTQFRMTGKIIASGNYNAVLNYEDLKAPLKEFCGFRAFENCSSLVKAPELSKTDNTSFACYGRMFYNCTSLTQAPELPATKLGHQCYANMFTNCTSLTQAPELPATKLGQYCYMAMFYNCTSLTTAPELPATELTYGCYYSMFAGCNLLTVVPKLPALKLVSDCYRQMFQDCSSLNSVECLATDISASNCTRYWLYGTSSTGNLYKNPEMNDWTYGDHGVPNNWNILDYKV